jgi:hypothetical protein
MNDGECWNDLEHCRYAEYSPLSGECDQEQLRGQNDMRVIVPASGQSSQNEKLWYFCSPVMHAKFDLLACDYSGQTGLLYTHSYLKPELLPY